MEELMRNFTPLLALLAIGCGPNLIGDWEGTCEFNIYEVDVELEIDDVDGKDFTGDVDAILRPNNGTNVQYRGELEGTRDGDEVDIDVTLVDADDVQFSLQISGTIDDDEIQGECQTGGDEGDIELDFQG